MLLVKVTHHTDQDIFSPSLHGLSHLTMYDSVEMQVFVSHVRQSILQIDVPSHLVGDVKISHALVLTFS